MHVVLCVHFHMWQSMHACSQEMQQSTDRTKCHHTGRVYNKDCACTDRKSLEMYLYIQNNS